MDMVSPSWLFDLSPRRNDPMPAGQTWSEPFGARCVIVHCKPLQMKTRAVCATQHAPSSLIDSMLENRRCRSGTSLRWPLAWRRSPLPASVGAAMRRRTGPVASTPACCWRRATATPRRSTRELKARRRRQRAQPARRNRAGHRAQEERRSAWRSAMLDAGADVNLAARERRHAADGRRLRRSRDMVATLLDEGADVNAVDRLKKNAMTYAAGEGAPTSSRCCSRRASIRTRVYDNDLTALMWAAGFGKTATVQGAARRRRARRPQGQPRQDGARHRPRRQVRAKPRRLLASARPRDDGTRAGRAPAESASARCARSPSARAARRDRRARASARRRRAARPLAASIQLVARCTPLRKSLSATFLPAQLGSVMPKYLTG